MIEFEDEILKEAKKNLLNLEENEELERVPLSTTQRIRELFDDIEILRKKRIKLTDIHNALNKSGITISLNHFQKELSLIRKEKGVLIRQKKPTKKTTTSTTLSDDEIKENTQKTKEETILIDESFISPLAEKDRSHYTSDDYQAELDLLEKLISENNRDKHKMYQILNGDLNDIKEFDLNTVSGRRQCHSVINRLLNRERRKYLELIKVLPKKQHDEIKENITLIDEDFISPLAEKNRDHYTREDYEKEWELVQKLLDQNKEDKFKRYRILNGNMKDIEGLNPKTLHGVQKLSEIVNSAEIRLRRHQRDLIKFTRE